jgi:hypothetical protein
MYCVHMANQWHLRCTLVKIHPESRQHHNAVSVRWFPRQMQELAGRLSQPGWRMPGRD